MIWWILGVVILGIILALVALVCQRSKPKGGKWYSEEQSETMAVEVASASTKFQLPRLTISSAQTIGTRENQEDSFGWSDPEALGQRGFLAIVSDGIGGLDDGQIASSTATKNMLERFARQDVAQTQSASTRLLNLTTEANRDVVALNQHGQKIGCTLVSILIAGWHLYMTSVGDSRICLYRNGGLLQLNRPHVFGKEHEEAASFARQEMRVDARRGKALTCYLGKEDLHTVDRNIQPMTLMPGDRILLMSDGVFGTLPEEIISTILENEKVAPADALITAVNAAAQPSQDNATAIVVSIT